MSQTGNASSVRNKFREFSTPSSDRRTDYSRKTIDESIVGAGAMKTAFGESTARSTVGSTNTGGAGRIQSGNDDGNPILLPYGMWW